MRTIADYLRKNYVGLVLLLPAVVLVAVVYIYPIIESLHLSLYDFNPLKPYRGKEFVGIQNYADIFQDGSYWQSLWVTFKFLAITISVQMVLGIAIAVMLNSDYVRSVYGTTFVRSIIIMPLMASPIVVGLIWGYLFDTDLGFINQFLIAIGLPFVNWLNDPTLALISVSIASIWQWTPLVVLLVLAGLESLPADPFDAARVDGASERQLFWGLTLPMLKPVILVTLLTNTIDAYRVFGLILVMTGGGPGTSTNVVSMEVYQTGFKFWRMGDASAQSFLTFLVILVVALVYMRLLRTRH
jgi:multiple sugar transport system permease protein